MCTLNNPYTKTKSKTAYKIVAVHNETGDYYSPAVGCVYPKNGRIKPVTEQRSIGIHWNDVLSPTSRFFSEKMIGRTAAFLDRHDADFKRDLWKSDRIQGYSLEVKKCIISLDMLNGNYEGNDTIAGRHIKFLE